MSVSRREPKLIEVPILEGRVTFLDALGDVVKSAMRLILNLAVELEKTETSVSLEIIEKGSSNITGARWGINGGALAVTLYPELPDSAIKVQAGAVHSSDLANALQYRDKIRETIEQNTGCRVIWRPKHLHWKAAADKGDSS